ncbi:MAG: hypothetical protein JWQ35_473 [Bacteriovoracaceae bacterium]|nr:hypothetical protein [Bacteriovoracaceae bacterium]
MRCKGAQMTNVVNTLSQLKTFICLSFSFLFLQISFAESVDPSIAKPDTKRSSAASSSSQNNSETLRKIQIIQIPSQQLNFKFSQFQTRWLTNENDWNDLWKKSGVEGDAPKLPAQWQNESVLSIFWPSKDAVVRIPTFTGAEITETDGVKQMRLYFNLNTPCFGIITEASPASLLLIDQSLSDIDRVVIHTDATKTTQCF